MGRGSSYFVSVVKRVEHDGVPRISTQDIQELCEHFRLLELVH